VFFTVAFTTLPLFATAFGPPGDGDDTESVIEQVKDYGYNFHEQNNISPDLQTLTTSLFGDRIDPSSGSVSFSHTDISIPGNSDLEVALRRTLSDPDSWFRETREFENWSIEIPHVRSTYITDKLNNPKNAYWAVGQACTRRLNSNPYFSRGHNKQTFGANKDSYWNGDTVFIPGHGSTKFTEKDGDSTYKRYNNKNWDVECIVNNDGSEGFKITLDNGVTYTMGKPRKLKSSKPFVLQPILSTYQCNGTSFPCPPERVGPSNPDSVLEYPQIFAFMLATRVEDRFGNWIDYTYHSDGRLKKISSNDSRIINIYYTDDRVSSITANGKTWQYKYDTSRVKTLKEVVRPDNKSWLFSHDKYSNDSLWIFSNIANHAQVPYHGIQCVATGERNFIDITHPEGSKGEFNVKEVCHGQSSVPKIRRPNPYRRSYESYYTPKESSLFSLNNKVITLTNGEEYVWSYQYSQNKGHYKGESFNSSHRVNFGETAVETAHLKSTTTINPDESKVIQYFDREYGSSAGNLMYSEYYDQYGVLHKRESFEYINGYDYGSPQMFTSIGESLDAFTLEDILKGHNASKKQLISNKTQHFTRLGDIYTQEIRGYDNYDLPQITFEYNNFSAYKKYVKKLYQHFPSYNLIGLHGSTSISSNGISYTEVSKTTYHSQSNAKNLPYQQKLLGRLVSSNIYHNDGNLKKTTYHGENRYEQFEDYYRGKARKITMLCPENDSCNTVNGSTSSTVIGKLEVNSDGTTKSVTDFKGNKVSYLYNPVGWLENIIYADPQFTSQTINYSNVTSPGDGKSYSGISTGMLKQTISQGDYEQSIYLDSFLRPVLTRKRDKKKSGSDVFKRNDFDYANRAVFQSFLSDTSAATRGYEISYDSLGRKFSEVRTTDSAETRYRHLSGNRVSVSDAKQNLTITAYRAYGSPSKSKATYIASPEGVNTAIDYNLFGQVSAITQYGITETRLYDSYQQLCKTARPDTGVTAFGYNSAGQMTWQAEGANGSTTACDTGQVPASQKTTFSYNNWGDISLENYPDGSPDKLYGYNEKGQLESLTAGITAWSYDYNSLGMVEKQTLAIDSKSFVIDPEYNSLGHVKSLTYPSGRVVEFSPNALGQATKAGTYASSAKYHANGSLDSFTYGNGLTYKRTLNSNQQPYELSVKQGSSYKSRHRYLYDNNSNVDYISDLIDSTYNIDLGYDDLDRLESASGKWGNGSFTYDKLGNLQSKNLGSQTLTYHYDTAKNRLSSVSGAEAYSFQYDARGNVANNGRFGLIFNRANQLTNAKGNAYNYDGYNRLVKKISDGKNVYSVYGISGTLYYREDSQQKKTDYIRMGSELVAKDDGDINTEPTPPPNNEPTTPPNVVNSLSGYGSGCCSFVTSWVHGSPSDVTYYELYKLENSGGSCPPKTICPASANNLSMWTKAYSGNAKTFTVSSNSDYVDFKVRACNALGCSSDSSVKRVYSNINNEF
tara:strand:- start:13885 stop:18270 length:4386 start_codon:yes stop_codon:yes gene_type:complete